MSATRPRLLAGAAALAALVAVGLPPDATARWLAGPDAPRLGSVATGFWIWKGLLLLHAIALAAWARSARDGATAAPATPHGPDEPGGRLEAQRAAWIVGGLVLLGLGLRWIAVDQGLWFDEIKTQVRYVGQTLGTVVTTYDDQNQHLLYSVLARLASVALGEGAAALRLPAVLLGIASLWAVYRFGRVAATRLEGVLAAALLTVSYHHVWFSQNARGYTGLLLWTLLASAAFVRLLRNEERSRWSLAAWYGLTIALAMYTHLTAAVLPAAHGLIALGALWARRGGRRPRPAPGPLLVGLGLAGTLSVQLYAPVLPQLAAVLLEPSLEGVTIAWKNPLWLVTELAAGLGIGVPGGAWILLPAGLIALVGLWSHGRRSFAETAVLWLPAVLTAIAIVALGHNLWPRFFFFAAGFAVLIGIRGVLEAARRVAPRHGTRIAVALVTLAALGSLTTVPRAWGLKQDYDGAEAFVEARRAPGDAVVMLDMCILPYREYRGKDWRTVDSADGLAGVEAAHDRTWVVYTFPTSLEALQPDVWARVRSGYREAARYPGTVRGGDIVVMVRE